jgi:hypothetical protein
MKVFCSQRVIMSSSIKRRPFEMRLNCSDCKYSKLNSNNKLSCILFKYSFLEHKEPYIETAICRSDVNLCGEHAEYFKFKK